MPEIRETKTPKSQDLCTLSLFVLGVLGGSLFFLGSSPSLSLCSDVVILCVVEDGDDGRRRGIVPHSLGKRPAVVL